LNSQEQEKPDKSAKTTSEAVQSMGNGERITSTSTSPISQKSLSEPDKSQGGSK
jgi:hypothetical protein